MQFLAVSIPLASSLPFVPSAVPLRKGYNGVQTHLQLPSFPSLCSLLTRPPSPRGRSLRGGLAHQSNASLIVAAVWASVRTTGKRKGGWRVGEQKDARVSCLTALRANDSSTDARGEAGTRPCVSAQTGGRGRGESKGTSRSHGPLLCTQQRAIWGVNTMAKHARRRKMLGWEAQMVKGQR